MIRLLIAFLVGITLLIGQSAFAQDAVFDPNTNTTTITFEGDCEAGVSLQPATSYAITCQSENSSTEPVAVFGENDYIIVSFDHAVFFLAINNSGQIMTLEPGYSYGILLKQGCVYAATEQVSVSVGQVGYEGHVDLGFGTLSYTELSKAGIDLSFCS